jgi:hypothetical protein
LERQTGDREDRAIEALGDCIGLLSNEVENVATNQGSQAKHRKGRYIQGRKLDCDGKTGEKYEFLDNNTAL